MFNLIKKNSVKTTAFAALAMAGNSFLAVETVQANEISGNILTFEQIQAFDNTNPMGQVTSVSQLRDVSPTDWAYEALRSLVERYGCIVGYPDTTFRGNRALSRYEFAAGLNACMQQMERLLAASEAVIREDIEKLKRLMKEFEAELVALGARVDNLEGRVAFLEDHQFSTTTKLKGEVLLAAVGAGGNAGDAQFTLSDRVRLTLDTSFTGKDRLRTRLSAGNVANIENPLGTNQARLNFRERTGNSVRVDRLYYKTKIGDKTTAWGGALLPPQDIYETFTPYTKSDGTGSLSRIFRFNPFIYRSVSGAGGAVKYEFNKTFDLTASYLAGDAEDPRQGNGLFNGTFSTGIQLGIHPLDNVDLGLAFMHSYFTPGDVNVDGITGSRIARRPFGNVATSSENLGFQANWRASDRVNVAGWFGYSWAEAQGGIRRGDNAELLTWSLNASYLDLFKEGSVATLAIGQAPYTTSVDNGPEDPDSNFAIEGNFKYPVTDNISITPGVYAVFNPENNDNNDTVVVGVIRTVFKF